MKKNTVLKFLSLTLSVLLLILPLASCAGKGKTLLTLSEDGTKVTFSVNLYEFMLSRMKGKLVANKVTDGGYSPDRDQFWDCIHLYNGENHTNDEIYRDLILDNCRTYLAAEWLFEARGLKLTQSAAASVDERLEELITDHADGSKTKFNTLLSAYRVNYDLLREIYLLEEKVTALQNDLYGAGGSQIGDDIKDKYLTEHYVRFKQIFFPTYEYEYEKDKNGDEIYYRPEMSEKYIAYDTASGVRKADKVTGFLTDTNGDDIYYTDTTYTRVAYDKTTGRRSPVLDKNGVAKTVALTEEEIKGIKNDAETLLGQLTGKSAAEFEQANSEHVAASNGENDYTAECYLNKDTDYSAAGNDFSYLAEICAKLETMQTGEVALVASASGYHLIMKYDPASGAYREEANAAWFTGFTSDLVSSLFLDQCRQYRDRIVLDEKQFANAKSMKEIGANTYF